jgi:hypothetical protein
LYTRSLLVTRFALVAVSVIALGSCGILDGDCKLDLRFQPSPVEKTIHVGDTFTVSGQAFGCGGSKRLTVQLRWSSSDTAVATVDSISGLVRGVKEGTAYIRAKDILSYGQLGGSGVTVLE